MRKRSADLRTHHAALSTSGAYLSPTERMQKFGDESKLVSGCKRKPTHMGQPGNK